MALRQFGAKREARGAVRRLIDLECGIYSDVWGEVIVHRVTDVSEDGLWVETELLLEVGSDVTLTFYPPDWEEPLCVAGRVCRVELEPKTAGSSTIGMGIAFDALRSEERRHLRQSMRCLRADAAYLLDQRTLVGVPVGTAGPGPESTPTKRLPVGRAEDVRRTVFGWGAPSDAAPTDPPEEAAESESRASLEAPASAFGGGLDLAASIFDPRTESADP
ncbi:MAG: PilZ domain-containing protein [Myxococcota bacterium]